MENEEQRFLLKSYLYLQEMRVYISCNDTSIYYN